MLKKCLFVVMVLLAPALYAGSANLYVRGLMGINFVSVPSTEVFSVDMEAGVAVAMAVGYKWAPFRVEFETTFRNNSFDQFNVKAGEKSFYIFLGGSASSVAYMGNVFFDFSVPWTITPYIGAGLGGYNQWGKMINLTPEGLPVGGGKKLHSCGGAYQLIAGLNLLRAVWFDLALEYHFWDQMRQRSAKNHTLAITSKLSF